MVTRRILHFQNPKHDGEHLKHLDLFLATAHKKYGISVAGDVESLPPKLDKWVNSMVSLYSILHMNLPYETYYIMNLPSLFNIYIYILYSILYLKQPTCT